MIPEPYFDELNREARDHLDDTGRPLVMLSYAQSLDGSLARRRGEPLALSGPQSLAFTHRLRSAHDAILVGIGTVLADDPRLTARTPGGRDPRPVILDTDLRTPAGARLWTHPVGPWLFSARGLPENRKIETERRGGQVFEVPRSSGGRLELPAVLDALGALGVAGLMVEGGAAVITSFLLSGLVDRAAITIAPVFVGGLRAPETAIPELPALTGLVVHRLGADIVVTGAFAHG
ncbi:MAG TPA: RibD family protein [Anaerolineales bacterium]|nr:RibD family protein [Anaerolineales bacterium]